MSRSTVDERFWSKVVKEPSCWRWTAARFSTGTGQFRVGQKMRQAHRVAWELTYGSPPPALLRSTCGNLQCVRPDHHVPVDRMGGATNLARTADKRFDAMVEKGPGCWQWTGSTTRLGYGQFSVMTLGEGRQMIPADRSPPPDDLVRYLSSIAAAFQVQQPWFMNAKRMLASILWFYAGWVVGAFVAMLCGFNDLIGPLVGVVAAALFAGDPLYLIWGPRGSTERIDSRLKSIAAGN